MTTTRQPGWYDDPNDATAQRYWDGQNWTPHRQRKPASAPHPPTQAQAPAARWVKAGVSKGALVLAGIALVVVIAALVAGRVELGTFLPGILIVAAIAVIGAIVTLRSHQSAARKAMVVAAIVLVVAVAIPASSKAVYPVYNHFFGAGGAMSGNPGAAQGRGAPGSPPTGGATSGILTLTVSSEGAPNSEHIKFGFIDPSSGEYSEAASFNCGNDYGCTPLWSTALAASPDLKRLAITKQVSGQGAGLFHAGWIDTGGKFTDVTVAAADPGPFGGDLPSYKSIGFDGSGNLYYSSRAPLGDIYKLPAGSTTNAQKLGEDHNTPPFLDYDGTMVFPETDCGSQLSWMGPDHLVEAANGKIFKGDAVKLPTGCFESKNLVPLLPSTNTANVYNPVSNRDGTQVAFKYGSYYEPSL
ncbi:MAG: DUF2510 domain-containing protein, partial [Mycobacterium sp.]